MAVRATLVRAAKTTLVGLAIVAGAVAAPGLASAAPADDGPILAPAPIVRIPPPGVWQCSDSPWANGGGVDFYCEVGAGITVTAAIECSDGRVYFRQVAGPAAQGFSLWCRNGAWVTNYTVTD
ncbi:hypothetical protein [Actinophytocola sp.]|uniref:hypothetical protein n=1 Tax=Actinophytocola sp. TaxID=1872138 RepID=UPI002D802AFF|nr:hypothetical protein [Actinophytocola sp.]HET9141025.1 hypothetical protein [Actinophytocola sp.]